MSKRKHARCTYDLRKPPIPFPLSHDMVGVVLSFLHTLDKTRAATVSHLFYHTLRTRSHAWPTLELPRWPENFVFYDSCRILYDSCRAVKTLVVSPMWLNSELSSHLATNLPNVEKIQMCVDTHGFTPDLSFFKNLQFLSINCGDDFWYMNVDLQSIKNLSHLRSLCLRDIFIDLDVLNTVASQLVHLGLFMVEAKLPVFPHVESLETNLDPSMLRHKFPSLQKLCITCYYPTTPLLLGPVQLTYLDISYEFDIASIVVFPLRTLILRQPGMTNDELHPLKKMSSLRSFSIFYGYKLTREFLQHLPTTIITFECDDSITFVKDDFKRFPNLHTVCCVY